MAPHKEPARPALSKKIAPRLLKNSGLMNFDTIAALYPQRKMEKGIADL